MSIVDNSASGRHAPQSADSAGGAGLTHHHILPLKVYFGVFAVLLVFTVLTVGVSMLGIPQPWSLVIAMVVALVKASLVATVFMHLKWDEPFNRLLFVGSLLFLGLFFFFTFADLHARGFINEEERPGLLKPVLEQNFGGEGKEVKGESTGGAPGAEAPAAPNAEAPK